MYEDIRRGCHINTKRQLGEDTVWNINKNIIHLYKKVSTPELIRNKNTYDLEIFQSFRCALRDEDTKRALLQQFEFETHGDPEAAIVPWLENALITSIDALLAYRRDVGEDVSKTMREAFGIVVEYMRESVEDGKSKK